MCGMPPSESMTCLLGLTCLLGASQEDSGFCEACATPLHHRQLQQSPKTHRAVTRVKSSSENTDRHADQPEPQVCEAVPDCVHTGCAGEQVRSPACASYSQPALTLGPAV